MMYGDPAYKPPLAMRHRVPCCLLPAGAWLIQHLSSPLGLLQMPCNEGCRTADICFPICKTETMVPLQFRVVAFKDHSGSPVICCISICMQALRVSGLTHVKGRPSSLAMEHHLRAALYGMQSIRPQLLLLSVTVQP